MTHKKTFTEPLLDWYDTHGRKDLPWQQPRTPYRVWISEIMLQQTQVKTVIPYFNQFMTSFPSINALASASLDDVLAHWSGLGYYSRARNLHKTAQLITVLFNSQFPSDLEQLIQLPGIGPSTAAAIASLAFHQPTAILDGNVKRVLSRYFTINDLKQLWQLANTCMSTERCADYTQAIMDLGATCCTSKKPQCATCPVQSNCLAKINNVVFDYPAKKPKKILPIKQQQFLLLHTQDSMIYLEQRPPTGLWGGLWCLPSIDDKDCAHTFLKSTYGIDADQIHDLMAFRHTFSHFHLDINARRVEVNVPEDVLAECSGRFFKFSETHKLGLAKPIQDIIRSFGISFKISNR